jgi:hypothetical protein
MVWGFYYLRIFKKKCILSVDVVYLCLPMLYCTVAPINLETPKFFYCKLFVTLTMLLTHQFRLRQSVECAQR